MTALPFFRTGRESFAKTPARARSGSALVALCLVALQLVTALHFALVPHGFSAGASGFVHVHRAAHAARSAVLERERHAAPFPTLASGTAACAPESCPIGFAGQHSLLIASSPLTALLVSGTAAEQARPARYATAQSRVLLSAPKTSPPV